MMEAVGEMNDWLQDLFPICIELGGQLEVGFKALVVMESILSGISSTNSR